MGINLNSKDVQFKTFNSTVFFGNLGDTETIRIKDEGVKRYLAIFAIFVRLFAPGKICDVKTSDGNVIHLKKTSLDEWCKKQHGTKTPYYAEEQLKNMEIPKLINLRRTLLPINTLDRNISLKKEECEQLTNKSTDETKPFIEKGKIFDDAIENIMKEQDLCDEQIEFWKKNPDKQAKEIAEEMLKTLKAKRKPLETNLEKQTCRKTENLRPPQTLNGSYSSC